MIVEGRSPEDPWIKYRKITPRPRKGVALTSQALLSGSLKALLGDPQGVEGVGKGLCTSVTASRMTDAYGASTLQVPHG